jgi:Na+-translocating ferredoxin:NAD+ oxidoreductase RnfC subunit
MQLIDQVRQAGVVGAGGGGFPAHVKLGAKAEIIIANGAECEPLLHKDAAVMEYYAKEVVRGVQLSMEATGAKEGVIGIKAKKKAAVAACQEACKGTNVRVELLGDFYPAGDEYDLVYTVTGKLIPPGGLAIHVGAVVANVETLMNISRATSGTPVTHKTITIAGAVAEPVSLTVPIGISYRECIAAAGGATCDDPVLAIGGLMMGETSTDLDRTVVKTSTGAIILPRDHRMIERKLKPPKQQASIGKSACDQCRYCTEMCPRFLLGYQVEPHQVMRSLAFTGTGSERWNEWAALCCSCGLCTLYACPEELYPKEACDDSKAYLRKVNFKWGGKMDIKVHPMRDGRHVPIKSLMRRLHVEEYDSQAPLRAGIVATDRVVLPLKQSAGAPTVALVKAGDTVKAGQPISEPAPHALGAIIHAPFAGKVTAVTPASISISKK